MLLKCFSAISDPPLLGLRTWIDYQAPNMRRRVEPFGYAVTKLTVDVRGPLCYAYYHLIGSEFSTVEHKLFQKFAS